MKPSNPPRAKTQAIHTAYAHCDACGRIEEHGKRSDEREAIEVGSLRMLRKGWRSNASGTYCAVCLSQWCDKCDSSHASATCPVSV